MHIHQLKWTVSAGHGTSSDLFPGTVGPFLGDAANGRAVTEGEFAFEDPGFNQNDIDRGIVLSMSGTAHVPGGHGSDKFMSADIRIGDTNVAKCFSYRGRIEEHHVLTTCFFNWEPGQVVRVVGLQNTTFDQNDRWSVCAITQGPSH